MKHLILIKQGETYVPTTKEYLRVIFNENTDSISILKENKKVKVLYLGNVDPDGDSDDIILDYGYGKYFVQDGTYEHDGTTYYKWRAWIDEGTFWHIANNYWLLTDTLDVVASVENPITPVGEVWGDSFETNELYITDDVDNPRYIVACEEIDTFDLEKLKFTMKDEGAGNIVISDGDNLRIVIPSEYVPSMTPIGVVVVSKEHNPNGETIFMSLDNMSRTSLGSGTTATGNTQANDATMIPWGTYNYTIPNLDENENVNLVEFSFDGKENTSKIINSCSTQYLNADRLTLTISTGMTDGNFPAAIACHRYSTSGTESGDWYLPSIKELCWLNFNRTKINNTLEMLDDEAVLVGNNDNANTYGWWLWSSSACSSYYAWHYDNLNDYVYDNFKYGSYDVCRVRAFAAFNL